MSSVDNKRNRAINFTELEVRFLIDVAIRHMSVIENKHTDAVTWKEKNAAWEQIAQEFNSLCGTTVTRTAKVLRLKYDCIKRNIKKKLTHNKCEIFKTGGGSKNEQPLTDYEDKLSSYLTLSIEGLPMLDDSDADFLNIACKTACKDSLNSVDIATVLAEVTVHNHDSSDVIVHSENLFAALNQQQKGDHKDSSNVDCIEMDLQQPKNNINDVEISTQNLCTEQARTENKENDKWQKWNPTQLKESKSKVLQRPKIMKNSLNKKIDALTDARKELLQLQLDLARKESEHKEEEHQERIHNLKVQRQLVEQEGIYKNNEQKLKEELLNLQIEHQKLLNNNVQSQ